MGTGHLCFWSASTAFQSPPSSFQHQNNAHHMNLWQVDAIKWGIIIRGRIRRSIWYKDIALDSNVWLRRHPPYYNLSAVDFMLNSLWYPHSPIHLPLHNSVYNFLNTDTLVNTLCRFSIFTIYAQQNEYPIIREAEACKNQSVAHIHTARPQ